MQNEKIEWGRYINGELYEKWPKNAAGEPENPVFLCNKKSIDMEDEMLLNMLSAYSIPCIRVYPGDGAFGRLVLGMSGSGSDIYVPESMLNDATNLCEESTDEKL